MHVLLLTLKIQIEDLENRRSIVARRSQWMRDGTRQPGGTRITHLRDRKGFISEEDR